ncbi:phosphotransferase [Micromonospora sp. U56]|uniref:phosphotransferase n=1 Tax=Micromonospora sp. U56 TaxID=2824900 RepID=UPI001B37520B|nr:phosphotransferase [Micromonospora sp. U56]MBQ0897869.1 phosphotransferase [Micromonospora sp. U56]
MPAATPLASGRDADVYALGTDRVIRRNRDGGDVRAEAGLMAYLRGQGYPVPEVFRADGPDLEMTRLTGPTLAEALVTGVADIRSGARILATLHHRLHALRARRSPDPAARVLHLDLHPQNVIVTADGPVVIDWGSAGEGPPELDLAMTALIVAEVVTDPASPFAAPAGELLTAFLAETGPVGLLDPAISLRTRTGPLDARRVAQAAARVRTAHG